MKTQKLLLGLIMISAMSTPTFAQEHVGNGGDAVICNGKPVRLLDQLEAETVFQKNNNLSSNEPYPRLVQGLIERIKVKDLARGMIFQSYWDEIKSEISDAEMGKKTKNITFTSEILKEVDDEMVISIPADCHLQQLVLQINPDQYEGSAWAGNFARYTVQKKLWNQLSSDQKAITILHEFWYRYFLTFGAKSSRNARALNAYFFTGNDQETSFFEYVDMLSKTEANGNKALRFLFKTGLGAVSSIVSLENGIGYGVENQWDQSVKSVILNSEISLRVMILKDAVTPSVESYNIKTVDKFGELCVGCSATLRFKNVTINSKIDYFRIELYDGGEVKAIYPGKQKIILKSGLRIKNPDYVVRLDPQGNQINE